MELSNAELRTQMTAANIRMLKKFKTISFALFSTYFLSLFFKDAAMLVASWSAVYVPAVAKLVNGQLALGDFPLRFFGVTAALIPIFAVWILWGENPRLRWRYGAMVSGRKPAEFLLMLYFLGVPFGIAFILLVYFAPIDMPIEPELWGHHLIHLMLNTYAGLLIFGIIAALATVVIGAFSLLYFFLPFAAVNNFLFNGSK